MKKLLMPIIKYCKPVYALYFYIGSFFLLFIKQFVRTNQNLILFVSYGGKKFDDSPRAIYDQMCKDPRFDQYELVWAFQDLEKNKIEDNRGKSIKTDTLSYFLTALKARVWITNSSIERGLKFTGKNTYFINTWHGTPMKKMGEDIEGSNTSFRSKNTWNMDIMLSQSNFEADIFSRVFHVDREKFRIFGLPRNDVLVSADAELRAKVRQELGITEGKKVILYAPTFREYDKDETMNCIFKTPLDWDYLKENLGEEYLILIRAHYEARLTMDLSKYADFIKDVSLYPELNKLMIASDMLISDYSSIFFDYSILERPMIAYTYDYEKYTKERGMYFDVREFLPGGNLTNRELLELILAQPETETLEKVRNFKGKFVEMCGNATKETLDLLDEHLRCHENL